MPHFIVEYTANIKADARLPELLRKGVEVLVAEGYPEQAMRARGVEAGDYRLADGAGDYAMVHVTLKIAPGRSDEKKQRTSQAVFDMLTAHFAGTFARRYLMLSVELTELVSSPGVPTLKKSNLGAPLPPGPG